MRVFASPRFLPALLWADAASAAATGVLQAGAAATLGTWFGLPPPLVFGAGCVLLAVAPFAAWLARAPRRGGVLALVAVNAAWVLGCIALLFAGAAGTAPGTAWLVLQGLAVGLLAELEWLAVRRAPAQALA